MSLASAVGALTRTKMLAAVSAANTAAASSAYIDVRGYEGQVSVEISQGIVVGTVDYTFSTNDAANSSGATLIVPLGGALAQITTSNDDAHYTAVFDAKQLRGYLSVVATVVTGPSIASLTFVGRKKYAA